MANPFFDAAYYLGKNPDVLAAGYTLATAEQHYLRYGAAESLTGPLRAPNAWFDARAYLAAYPDLTAQGVTAATALSHYVSYGINENRSPAANVNPADFTYTDYAAANNDLRIAFGITDPAHITAQQQHQLLAHYLSYGIHEARAGVNSTVVGSFFNPGTPGHVTDPIVIDAVGQYSGTSGDDLFTGADTTLNGSTLDGKAGTDTLQAQLGGHTSTVALVSVEKIAATLSANTVLNISGAGVSAVSVTGNGHTLSYIGNKVDSFSLLGAGGVIAAMTGTASGNDHLDLSVAAGAGTGFGVTGIEDFAVNLATGASLSLSASATQGGNVSVAISGGASNSSSTFDLSTDAALASLSVNGSAFAGNLVLGSVGGAATVATLTGGAGNDTLNASAGRDLLTGGAGNDVFHFGAGSGAPINLATNAVDTLLDFSLGDRLEFAGAGTFSVALGANLSLADAVAAVEAAVNQANQNIVFTLGSDTYFQNTGNGAIPAAVIKLVLSGGADLAHMVLDTNGVHFSA